MTNTVRYIRYWEAYQRCTDVIYRRIPIFSTHRYCLFSFCSFIRCQHFVRAYGKIFICLKYVWIKNTFVKTEGRQTSSSRAGALFLFWKPWRWKDQLIACFPVIVFSAILIWLKKIFLFADRCTRKRSLQISMKRNPEYTGEDSLVSFSLFSVSTASAQILWRKNIFFAVFLKT